MKDENDSIKALHLEKESVLLSHQQEVARIKELLAAKELELEEERTRTQEELVVAREKFNEMSEQSQKIMGREIEELQKRLNGQMKLNKDLRANGLAKKPPRASAVVHDYSDGRGIDDVIDELDEDELDEEEESFAQPDEPEEEFGEMKDEDEDSVKDVRVVGKSSRDTSLASLLMMQDAARYETSYHGRDDAEAQGIKIEHSSADDSSGVDDNFFEAQMQAVGKQE